MRQTKILVPVDFSSLQENVVEQATRIAVHLSAELILLHCATPPELSIVAVEPLYIPAVVMENFTRDHSAMVTQKMDALASELRTRFSVKVVIKASNPVDAIPAVAEDENCDLIVMGSHGAGIDRFLLGSVAESVTRTAPCSVVVCRTEPTDFSNVIVGIDFSVYSRPLVELARKLSSPNAEIHLIHSWQPPHLDTAHLFGNPGHETLIAGLTSGLQEHASLLDRFAFDLPDDDRYVLHVESGRPASTLLDLAEELGTAAIFVGAHGSDRIERLLGTVSDRVIRHGGTTVLLTETALSRNMPVTNP